MSRVVLVLGCHRSGTSLLARSLECLGAELGARAHWSGDDNPDFAEDQDILGIDQALMYFTMSTWDSPAPLEWHALPTLFQNGFSERVRELLVKRLEKHPTFGIKEPRMCRLLPFWKPMFQSIGCEVSVVHVVRHPLAVAHSLEKRNGIPIEDGLKLWREYIVRARDDADPTWPAVTVCYDNLIELPVQQIERIGAALGLSVNAEATQRFAREFVKDDLRHEVGGEYTALPLEVAVLWQMVREVSRQW